MPAIFVEAGKLNDEQKKALCVQMTKDAAEIMQLPEQAFMVFVRENPLENVSVGGVMVSDMHKNK